MSEMANILSFSGGKDSTAMLHMMLSRNEPVDEVVYFGCDWDFPQMDDHLRLVEENTGIYIVRIRSYRHFNEYVRRYGMPHKSGGWCTARKRDTLMTFMRAMKRRHGNITEFIGFSTDELHRTERKTIKARKWNIRYPLIEYDISSAWALDYCYGKGYDWNGLYNHFRRVSCFCCPKAGTKRIDTLKKHYPELHEKYLDLLAQEPQ